MLLTSESTLCVRMNVAMKDVLYDEDVYFQFRRFLFTRNIINLNYDESALTAVLPFNPISRCYISK